MQPRCIYKVNSLTHFLKTCEGFNLLMYPHLKRRESPFRTVPSCGMNISNIGPSFLYLPALGPPVNDDNLISNNIIFKTESIEVGEYIFLLSRHLKHWHFKYARGFCFHCSGKQLAYLLAIVNC